MAQEVDTVAGAVDAGVDAAANIAYHRHHHRETCTVESAGTDDWDTDDSMKEDTLAVNMAVSSAVSSAVSGAGADVGADSAGDVDAEHSVHTCHCSSTVAEQTPRKCIPR